MVERRRKIATDRDPHRKGQRGNRHNRGDKDARDLVGHALDGGLGAGGLVNQADDAGKGGVLAHRAGLHHKPTTGSRGSTRDLVALGLLHGKGLSRKGALVDRGRAFHKHAVDRHGLARAHDHTVAHLHVLGGHVDLLAIAQNARRLGRQVHERRDGVGSARLGAGLEVLTQVDQGQNHARRVKVQAVHRGVGCLHVHGAKGPGHLVEAHQAVGKARGRAHGNERVHVGRTVPQGPEAHDEVAAVDEEDGGAQDELRHGGSHHVVHAVQARHLGPAQHGTHGNVEEGHG